MDFMGSEKLLLYDTDAYFDCTQASLKNPLLSRVLIGTTTH